MKKFYLALAAVATASASALAVSTLPNALYVVKDGTYQKFNFGVASDLVFSNNGKTLSISGYNRQIDLDNIDYITFEAPMTESLTASQHKERLVKIGKNFTSLLDVNRQSELIGMCNSFVGCLEDDRDEPVYSPYHNGSDSGNGKLGKEFTSIMKSVSSFSKGSLASVKSITRSAAELFRVDDYFGIYEVNSKTHDLEKTSDADYLEVRWSDDEKGAFSVVATKSADRSRYETSDFRFEMPGKIEIGFMHGNTILAKATVTSELTQDKSIGLNLDFESNGYVVNTAFTILDDVVKESKKVWIDDTLLVDANNEITGRHLLAYDELKDDLKEASHYHDEDDNCCGEDPERLLSHFIKGSSNADILGELQLKGMVYDPLKIYNRMKEEDEDWHYDPYSGCVQINDRYVWGRKVIDINADKSIVNIWESESNGPESIEPWTRLYNDYSDISFFYDNSPELQGFLGFDTSESTWSYSPRERTPYTIIDGRLIYLYERDGGYYADTFWYDENDDYHWEDVKVDDNEVFFPVEIIEHWYNLTPKLFFPDMTSHYFEDFFDGDSFRSLINDYDALIDAYMSIIRQDD